MSERKIRLNQIQQDGASTGNVPRWNGTAWVPTPPSTLLTGADTNTLRHDGTEWVASTLLRNNGSVLSINKALNANTMLDIQGATDKAAIGVSGTYTVPTNSFHVASAFNQTFAPSANSSTTFYNTRFESNNTSTNGNITASTFGLGVAATNTGGGTITNSFGAEISVTTNASTTTSNQRALQVQNWVTDATVTNAQTLRVLSSYGSTFTQTNSTGIEVVTSGNGTSNITNRKGIHIRESEGTVNWTATTNTGLEINNMSRGTTNYSIITNGGNHRFGDNVTIAPFSVLFPARLFVVGQSTDSTTTSFMVTDSSGNQTNPAIRIDGANNTAFGTSPSSTFRVLVAGATRSNGVIQSVGTGNTLSALTAASIRAENTTAAKTWNFGVENSGSLLINEDAEGTLASFSSTGNTSILKNFLLASTTTLSLSATNNAMDAGKTIHVSVSGPSGCVVNGIVGGVAGRILIINNTGSNTISFNDENASATAANRLSLGDDVEIAQRGTIMLRYHTDRWQCIGIWNTSLLSSGGGGSPAGADKTLQFNNNGVFGAVSNILEDGGNLRMTPSNPSIPAAGGLTFFNRLIASRNIPTFAGPSGLSSALQPLLAQNKIAWANPLGNATTISYMGMTLTAAPGAFAAMSVATTNIFTAIKKVESVNSTASTSAVAGMRYNQAQYFIGNNSFPHGGFFFVTRFAPSTASGSPTDWRCFVGFSSATASITADSNPSTATQFPNIVGVGLDGGDSTWQIMTKTGTGTAAKTDTTIARGGFGNEMYEICLYTVPSATPTIHYQLTRLSDGVSATGSVTSDLPAADTLLAPRLYISVGGSVSSTIGIALASMYIETDY